MSGRFEELWNSAADDGASCPVGVLANATRSEVDDLMDAWFAERTDRIECALLVDLARKLVAGMLADGEITPRRRRQAGRFLRSSRSVLNRAGGAGER